MKNRISGAIFWVNKVEDWFLILMLAGMVILAVAQIAYRNFFDSGVSWIDPFLRTLVLWVALSGAIIATRTDKHIRIDFFTRKLTPVAYGRVQRVVYVFCFVVCLIVSWHAFRFVQMEYQYGTVAFANVPAWITQLVIPAGFLVMALRYFMLLLAPPTVDKR